MDDPLGLDGKVALVTGAGAGIGAACTLRLAAAGCAVAALDVDAGAAERTAAEVTGNGGRALALGVDVRDTDGFSAAVERCRRELGELDVCVNNAGGMAGHPLKRFLEVTPGFVTDAIELNLSALFRCCQTEARAMVERGAGGSIVNVSSLGGVRAVRGVTAYGAAKAGVINLTQTMAIELGPHGIRTNAIAPGTTLTPAAQDQVGHRVEATAAANPMRRVALPDDMAGVVLFLASDLAAYVNGQVIAVDGGFSAAVGVQPRSRSSS